MIRRGLSCPFSEVLSSCTETAARHDTAEGPSTQCMAQKMAGRKENEMGR